MDKVISRGLGRVLRRDENRSRMSNEYRSRESMEKG